MTSEQRGSIYAILSGFLYGFIGYFGMSAINEHMSISTMLAWRFLITSLAIFIFIIPKLNAIHDGFNKMLIAFVTGAIFYGLSTQMYFQASEYIGSGMAMVIFFTYPVFILVYNYFVYKQPISRHYFIAVTIITLGMLMLIDFKSFSFDMMGILLALVSSVLYGAYIIASKNNRISPLISTLMVSLGCMLTTFIMALCTQTFMVPNSMSLWLNLTGIAVIATAVPILLMLHSLEFISSEKASILSVLEPVFVVIWGVILLGERLNAWNAVGIVLILAGALLTLFSQKKA